MKRLALALLVIGGCEADLHHTPDGGALPAMPDTLGESTGEPPANAVKLHVTRGGGPVRDVAVFFQTADSRTLAQALTNATGLAWAVMPEGGFVTALDDDELTTFSAVQSGDALELELGSPVSTASTTFTLQVPPAIGATAYKVYSPCGTQTMDAPSGEITLVGCPNPTDLVVVPVDVDAGALYASKVDTKTAMVGLVGTYEPFAANEYTLSNVPDTVPYVSLYGAFSAQYRAFEANSGAGVTANTATIDMAMPSNAGTELTVATEFPTTGEIGREAIYNWHAPTTTFTLDVANAQLKRYASAPAFAGHALTWTERTSGGEPDFVRAKIHLYRDGFPQGRAWHWRIAAPRTATTITFPTLPVVDFDFNLKDTDVGGVDELETIAMPGGYPRTNPFAAVTRAISGTSGQIVVQSLYFESL
jgi:hypothetical protein